MDMDTFIEQAEKRIAELKQQNGNLKEEISELEKLEKEGFGAL